MQIAIPRCLEDIWIDILICIQWFGGKGRGNVKVDKLLEW